MANNDNIKMKIRCPKCQGREERYIPVSDFRYLGDIYYPGNDVSEFINNGWITGTAKCNNLSCGNRDSRRLKLDSAFYFAVEIQIKSGSITKHYKIL